MKRYVLLAGVATALALAPSAAFAGNNGGDYNDDPLTFENHVSTTLENASYQFELTGIIGGVLLYGTIDPDSAANAITDTKQILYDESVTFSDPASSGDDYDHNNNNNNNNDHHNSDPATVHNNAEAGDVNGDGNVGVNVAAGQYNMQQNSANIAVSADSSSEADGGWASAATTGYQSLTNTSYGVSDLYTFDNNNDYGGGTHYQDRNNATGGDVGGSGNVGVNVAAGAFNQQQNLLTLAVANNSVLSQSNAALWQTASCNNVDIQDQRNNATSGVVNGAGNLGVNIAAGVGNQQQNSLTAAVSGPFGG
jgi:hypothetical protein